MSHSVLPDQLDQYPGYFPAKLPPWRRRWVQVVTASFIAFIVGIAVGAAPSASTEQQMSLSQAHALARDAATKARQNVEADLAKAQDNTHQAVEKAVAKERAAVREQLLQARAQVRQVRAQARARIKDVKAHARQARAAAVAAAVANSAANAPSTRSRQSLSGGSSSSGLDPRFNYCYEANDAGYGPYYKGQDPEYNWYDDADGDGIVCER